MGEGSNAAVQQGAVGRVKRGGRKPDTRCRHPRHRNPPLPVRSLGPGTCRHHGQEVFEEGREAQDGVREEAGGELRVVCAGL